MTPSNDLLLAQRHVDPLEAAQLMGWIKANAPFTIMLVQRGTQPVVKMTSMNGDGSEVDLPLEGIIA